MRNIVNYEICKLADRLRLNIVTFGHALVNTDWSGKILSPIYSRLYYITKGDFDIVDENGRTLKLCAGKWYFIPAGCSFTYKCNKEMEHFYFHLKLCDLGETDLLCGCVQPLCMVETEGKESFMLDCLRNRDAMGALLLKQLVLDVLLEILQRYNIEIKPENYSPCVMRAFAYIKENLSARLTISEIAEGIYVSKSTLTKHFKKELSMSVNEYLYSLLMADAEYLLRTENLSVGAISDRLGFSDQFYFSRRFKESFGQSPREYRKHKLI